MDPDFNLGILKTISSFLNFFVIKKISKTSFKLYNFWNFESPAINDLDLELVVIIFQKENGNTFTLLIIFIVKSLQKEQNSTNLLLWPPICRNKSAITPKWFNSLDTNSTFEAQNCYSKKSNMLCGHFFMSFWAAYNKSDQKA